MLSFTLFVIFSSVGGLSSRITGMSHPRQFCSCGSELISRCHGAVHLALRVSRSHAVAKPYLCQPSCHGWRAEFITQVLIYATIPAIITESSLGTGPASEIH